VRRYLGVSTGHFRRMRRQGLRILTGSVTSPTLADQLRTLV